MPSQINNYSCYNYCFSAKEKFIVSATLFVALVAIGLGILALESMGADAWIFHGLGGMQYGGAWTLVAVGSSCLIAGLAYIGIKLRRRGMLFRNIFDSMANQQYLARPNFLGKYCVWQPDMNPQGPTTPLFICIQKQEKNKLYNTIAIYHASRVVDKIVSAAVIIQGQVITEEKTEEQIGYRPSEEFQRHYMELSEHYMLTQPNIESPVPKKADYKDHTQIHLPKGEYCVSQ